MFTGGKYEKVLVDRGICAPIFGKIKKWPFYHKTNHKKKKRGGDLGQ